MDPRPGLVYYVQDGDILAVDPFEGEPKKIAAGRDPVPSPDGERLAYVSDTALVVADADGANPDPLLAGSALGRPAWSPDGTRLAVIDAGVIKSVEIESRESETVADGVDGTTLSYAPDGKRLAFDDGGDIVDFDLGTGERRPVERGTQPSFGPDGDIVFVRSEGLWILQDGADEAERFDAPRASGEPSEFGHRRPAYAPDGTAVVFEREDGEHSWITWAPLTGEPRRLTAVDGEACCPAWAAEPPPLPGLSIADTTSAEGEPLLFAVTIPAPVAHDVSVTGTTQQDTATSGEDFVTRVFEVTIPAGETQAVFDVATVEDTLDESDETLHVLLANAQGGVISDGRGDGVILDDDGGPTVSIADTSIVEGFDLRFDVNLSAPAPTDVTVTATTANGSATSPGDYTHVSASVEIPAGQTNAGFVVPTLDDTLDEPAETLTVTLSSPQGATIADESATGTIVDRSRVIVGAPEPVAEGGALRFPVRLDHPAAEAVAVDLETEDGTATASDYTARSATVTIPAGQSQAFFDVATLEDLLDEDDETVTARIVAIEGPAGLGNLAATGTIQDKPAPTVSVLPGAAVTEGAPLQFPVRLTGPRSVAVTVNLTTQDGTAVAPGDYTATSATVTIPAGQTEVQFTVPTVDDGFDEPDETVTARITGGTGALPAVTTATGTIADNDEPLPVVRVDAPAAVDEGSPLRFPLRLDRPAPGPVDIRLSTVDGTATAPGDYTAQTLTLVRIPAGATEAFLDVPTVADLFDEGDETVRAEIKSGTNATPSVLSATGTIRNKPAPRVSVGPAPAVTEGAPLQFPVRLTGTRPSAVTVSLTTQDGTAQAPGDYTATTTTVTIPAGQTETNFTVPTSNDGFDEPDETVTARITGGTNAFPTVLTATGTILDDDLPLPVVRVDAPAAVDEGSPLRFPLRLDRAAPGPIDIRLSTANGTATAPDDYTAQSLTLVRIPAGQTEAFLEVPTATDELAESDETVRAEIKSGTNATPSVLSATGTIRDAAGPVRLVPGRIFGGKLVSGKVLVRPPRGDEFVDLGAVAGLPVGTRVDAREGVIELTNASRRRAFAAQTRRSRFWGGAFVIRRAGTLELTGKCRRRLWADGAAGFTTKGRYAAATSRNGRWLVEDRCGSTRVKVTRGRVTVTARGTTTTLRKGRSLTVRP